MKKQVYLVGALLALIVLPQVQGSLNNTQTLTNTGTIDHTPKMATGVNYLSMYHSYSSKYTTNEVLNRDFGKFKQDGISVISLSLYWYRLEGNTQGSYNGTLPDGSIYGNKFLDDVKRVIAVADQNGLKVLITFHTLWGDDSPWCTPDYVVDPVSGKNIGLAIVRSSEIRQAFIETVNYTITYLAGTPGVWAWAILNEPWYWGKTSNEHDFVTSNGKTQKENFITLFQELANIVKTIDGRPTTIRFVNAHTWIDSDGSPYVKNIFDHDWGWDQRIFSALDFISLNTYLPADNSIQNEWENITKYNIFGCSARNRKVWITEFGSDSDSDVDQSEVYRSMLMSFKSLQVEGALAWFWRGDSVPIGWASNPGQFGKGYNLCASEEGTHRTAYYEFR